MHGCQAVLWFLFPTWVGVIPDADIKEIIRQAFPHMGGGDPIISGIALTIVSFSPHGWG